MDTVIENLGKDLTEALEMIKKDAEKMGIDITNLKDMEPGPELKDFPLAIKAKNWYVKLVKYYRKEEKRNVAWLLTEEALDLEWYAGTLTTRIYKQFCNKWYIDNEKNYGDFDYKYTASVLVKVSQILDQAFIRLVPVVLSLKPFHKTFLKLDKEIRSTLLIPELNLK